MKAKLWNLNTLLYVALLLALLSSLGHVAFAFSTVNGGNWIEAYISAVSIDVGLLALAAGINNRKAQDRSTKWLWAGVIFFSAISTYANWLAGLAHVKPFGTELGTMAHWLVSLRPILLSAVLPILVIYLSEIVSGNYQIEQKEAEKEAKKQAKRDKLPANDTTFDQTLEQRKQHLEQANDTRQAQKELRQQKILDLLHEGMSQSQMADELQVSLTTIKRDVKELNGRAG